MTGQVDDKTLTGIALLFRMNQRLLKQLDVLLIASETIVSGSPRQDAQIIARQALERVREITETDQMLGLALLDSNATPE